MTDRIHSITLILEKDVRVDDAERLLELCQQFKQVIEVVPNVSDGSSVMAEARARQELGQKIIDVIYPKR